ncbi:MAG: bifunctional UDP-sugar hydrolase/5'-nucleotidase, partial [Haloplanus sp.]
MGLRLLHYSDIESAYDHPDRLGHLVETLDARRDDETLVVGTGDNVGPSVLSIATDGRQAVDLFEAIRPDVSTLGNHDLDYGVESLLTVVRESPQTWVCANASVDGRPIGQDAGIVPSVVLDVGGQSIGFFGLLDPETATSSPVAERLSVTPPLDAARELTHALRADGATHVVALAHTRGIEAMARSLDVDVVLSGHVHAERLDRIEGTLLSRPGVDGEVVNEVTLADGRWSGTRLRVAAFPVDADVADAFRHRLPAEYTQTVVTLSRPVARPTEKGRDTATHVGQHVARAYRTETDADVGLQHHGGVHGGPPLVGRVTVADLVGTVPYQDPVCVVSVTGEQLREILARSCTPSDDHSVYLSGATVEHDADGTPVPSVDGAAIVDDSSYTLATTAYLLGSEPIASVL